MFDNAVFKRVKRHHGENAAFGQRTLRRMQRGDEFAELVIDRDAQRLKTFASLDECRPVSRRDPRSSRRSWRVVRIGRCLAVGDDSAGDAARSALLAK